MSSLDIRVITPKGKPRPAPGQATPTTAASRLRRFPRHRFDPGPRAVEFLPQVPKTAEQVDSPTETSTWRGRGLRQKLRARKVVRKDLGCAVIPKLLERGSVCETQRIHGNHSDRVTLWPMPSKLNFCRLERTYKFPKHEVNIRATQLIAFNPIFKVSANHYDGGV